MADELRFDNRVAIITGAGGGLGRAHALLLASKGAKLVVNDLGGDPHGAGRGQAAADKVVQEIKSAGGEAVANYDSVTQGDKIVQCALDTFGTVDIVINNAGILRDVSFHKMTDEDWDLVYQVHLHGSYKVTRAAWPHLRDKQYGRVIMTISAAGLYGNFGQANYSTCKLGLLGLTRTLAIEGANRNVFVNAIAPIAGSRLTATVLPDQLLAALRPEYVSPLAAYLCHESSRENGGVFELGAGWFAKLRWQRTKGATLPLAREITIQDVAKNWDRINDWAEADNPATAQDAFAPIAANLSRQQARRGNENIDLDKVIGYRFKPGTVQYTTRDVSLYALGVGAAKNPLDRHELKFVYELNPDGFQALPTFAVTFAQQMLLELLSVPGLKFNPALLLHGEQYLELRGPIPVAGQVTSEARISHVYDKGKGALLIIDAVSRDEAGREIAFNQYSAFIRGLGGFGGERGPSTPANEPPGRPADCVEEFKTNDNQALLYRLSGDINPLHADPDMAAIGGFERPILHGLCALGIAGRAILKHCCDYDPARLKSLRVRFAKHVFPGETLVTEMWKTDDSKIIFRSKVKQRDEVVLTNAVAELQAGVAGAAQRPEAAAQAAATNGTAGQVAALFAQMDERIRQNPGLVEKVGGVYRFDITGPEVSTWTVDLKNGPGGIKPDASTKADCTITVAGRDFLDMAAGKLNPQAAFMQGKLKIGGNVAFATKLELLMKG